MTEYTIKWLTTNPININYKSNFKGITDEHLTIIDSYNVIFPLNSFVLFKPYESIINSLKPSDIKLEEHQYIVSFYDNDIEQYIDDINKYNTGSYVIKVRFGSVTQSFSTINILKINNDIINNVKSHYKVNETINLLTDIKINSDFLSFIITYNKKIFNYTQKTPTPIYFEKDTQMILPTDNSIELVKNNGVMKLIENGDINIQVIYDGGLNYLSDIIIIETFIGVKHVSFKLLNDIYINNLNNEFIITDKDLDKSNLEKPDKFNNIFNFNVSYVRNSNDSHLLQSIITLQIVELPSNVHTKKILQNMANQTLIKKNFYTFDSNVNIGYGMYTIFQSIYIPYGMSIEFVIVQNDTQIIESVYGLDNKIDVDYTDLFNPFIIINNNKYDPKYIILIKFYNIHDISDAKYLGFTKSLIKLNITEKNIIDPVYKINISNTELLIFDQILDHKKLQLLEKNGTITRNIKYGDTYDGSDLFDDLIIQVPYELYYDDTISIQNILTPNVLIDTSTLNIGTYDDFIINFINEKGNINIPISIILHITY